jgi:hypothetical protein
MAASCQLELVAPSLNCQLACSIHEPSGKALPPVLPQDGDVCHAEHGCIAMEVLDHVEANGANNLTIYLSDKGKAFWSIEVLLKYCFDFGCVNLVTEVLNDCGQSSTVF